VTPAPSLTARRGPQLGDEPTSWPLALRPQVQPEELVAFEPEQMASRARQQENSKIREHMAAEAVRGQSQQASTDQFK
jgi:hypothetical protein